MDERSSLLPPKLPSIQSEKSADTIASTDHEPAAVCHDKYVDQILSAIGFGNFQILAFILAGLTYMAYISQTLTFSFASIDIIDLWHLNAVLYSLVSVITCATNLVGEVFSGYVADRYGRFWPYAVNLLLLGTFIAISAISNRFLIFLALRAVAAIGTGGLLVLTHPTLVEFLPVKNRGIPTVLTGLMQAIGSCIAGGFAWWLIRHYKNDGWRYYILFTAGTTGIAFLYRIIFCFESPRFLVSKGKIESAWKLFATISRVNRKDITAITNKKEFFTNLALEKTEEKSRPRSESMSFLRIFKQPYLKRTLCFLVIYNTQDISYFGSTLFMPYSLQALGVDPYFVSFVGFTAQIPGIALMAIIVEWPEIGRLRALRIFSFLSALSFFVFGFVQNEVATPVLTVFVYFSMVPNQSLIMTYISESFPTDVRVRVLSLVTTVSAINGLWTPFVSGYMAEQMKVHPWLSSVVWGSAFFLQFVMSLLLNHETRGKSLQDNIST